MVIAAAILEEKGSGVRMKSWTPEGGDTMYTKEQEESALREYEQIGSVTAVIRRLGYPSESTALPLV